MAFLGETVHDEIKTSAEKQCISPQIADTLTQKPFTLKLRHPLGYFRFIAGYDDRPTVGNHDGVISTGSNRAITVSCHCYSETVSCQGCSPCVVNPM